MIYLKSLKHLPARLYNSETKNYSDRITANGGTISVASLDAIEKFVQDCKNALIWDKLLEVAPFAGNDLNAALVKLIYPAAAPGVITNVNFVAGDYAETGGNGGLLGDGATKYLNTGFNAQTSLPDNSHLSFYLREDVGASGNRGMLGGFAGTDQYWIGSLVPTGQVDVRLGQSAMASYPQSLGKGFYLGNRVSTSSLKLYKNGAAVATDSSAITHTKPNISLLAFAFSSSGSPSGFLPGRGSFYSIGQTMTDSEALALHQAVRTLQLNLNRCVN